MNILDDFKQYRDAFGFNQINPGETSQNGSLFTLEYLLCLMARKDVTSDDKAAEIRRVGKVFLDCEREYGLIARYPGSEEFNAIDNHVAHLIFDWLYGDRGQARRIEARGAIVKCEGIDETQDVTRNKKFYLLASLLSGGKPKYFWNISNPNKFCYVGWLYKYPGFMGILDMVTKGETSKFRALALFVGQMLSCFDKPDNTSGTKLALIVWELLKNRGGVWKIGYEVWKYVFNKKYHGPQDLYLEYYKNPNHPIVKYSSEVLT